MKQIRQRICIEVLKYKTFNKFINTLEYKKYYTLSQLEIINYIYSDALFRKDNTVFRIKN